MGSNFTDVVLGKTLLARIYFDEKDSYLTMSVFDGDHFKELFVITDNRFKVRKGGNDRGVSIRRYEKLREVKG